jgi:hypothetical protein
VRLRVGTTLRSFASAIDMTLAERHIDALLRANDVKDEVVCRQWA